MVRRVTTSPTSDEVGLVGARGLDPSEPTSSAGSPTRPSRSPRRRRKRRLAVGGRHVAAAENQGRRHNQRVLQAERGSVRCAERRGLFPDGSRSWFDAGRQRIGKPVNGGDRGQSASLGETRPSAINRDCQSLAANWRKPPSPTMARAISIATTARRSHASSGSSPDISGTTALRPMWTRAAIRTLPPVPR